jgi:hypothetical protein
VPRETKTLDEKKLESDLCRKIESGTDGLRSIEIETPSGHRTLLELVGDQRPTILDKTILQDTSDWNENKNLSKNMFHGITPDIVLRSNRSRQNRIIIEVKKTSRFTHREPDASQVLRYFLHLLVTSDKNKHGEKHSDMERAVLLAAPMNWFKNPSIAAPWNHFVDKYQPLAVQFEITIGRIVLNP